MKKLIMTACAAVVAAVTFGGTISLELTKNCSLAEALAAYNEAASTAYTDTDGGASLAANDIEVSGAYVLTMTNALASWTGDLIIKSGAIVYAESDNTSYATVLGAAVSDTTTNGVVRVEDGATLQLRTNSSGNGNKLARPVYVTGKGVNGKGALRLSSTTNIRAMYPRYIHLDGDTLLTRLGNDAQLNGGTGTENSYFYLHNHVLTFGKADYGMMIIIETPNVVTGGRNAGLVVDSGCSFAWRDNLKNWDGDSNNFVRAIGSGYIQAQNDFTIPTKWNLLWDSTHTFDPGNYRDWAADEVAGERCWDGPVLLNKRFYFACGNASFTNQLGLLGKVSGVGSIGMTSTKGSVLHSFYLGSGENDFTGGFGATNYFVRLMSPTAVPCGEGKGAMLLQNCNVDLHYNCEAGAFKFPATTFDGAGKFYSKNYADAIYPHKGEFESLTKTGSGELEIDARLTGGELEIKEGTVNMKSPTESEQRVALAGVNRGQSKVFACYGDPFTYAGTNDLGWGSQAIKDVFPYILYTNTTTTALDIFSTPHGSFGDATWTSKFYQKTTTYDGWLENSTGADMTIKVICTLNAYVKMTIGAKVFDIGASSDSVYRNMLESDVKNPLGQWNITVPAGMNRFELRIYDRYGNNSKDGDTGKWFCYGNICTNGLSNWDDQHGLVWTDAAHKNSKDLNDYHRLDETGYGLALYQVSEFEDDAQKLDKLSGTGSLVLGEGATVRVSALEGAVQVTSGTVELVANGKVANAGFGAGKFKLNPKATDSYTEYVAQRKALAGLTYGYKTGLRDSPTPDGTYKKGDPAPDYVDPIATNGKLPVTNANYVVRIPYDIDHTELSSKTKDLVFHTVTNSYRSYVGYIWNDETTNVVWSILCTQNERMWLKIGDNNAVEVSGTQDLKCRVWNFTLQPGANQFTWICWNQYSGNTLYGPTLTNDVVNYTPGETYGFYYDKLGRGTKNLNDYAKFSGAEELPLFTTAAVTVPMTVAFDEITCVEGTVIDCNGEAVKVGKINGSFPQLTNGSIVLTDNATGLDLGIIGSLQIDVEQDANKRRADLTGMWYGLVVPANTNDYTIAHATASYYANALADTKADFYMTYPTNEVVTEMAPMTHVTTWPMEGEEYKVQWTSTATDSFWATDPNRYKTWKGYVWNSSSTNEIWTVINCNNAYVDLRLNGTQCYKSGVTDNRYLVDMTYSGQNGYSRNTYIDKTHLTNLNNVASAKKTQIAVVPGPNELKVRYYSRWNICAYWPGATETNINGAVFTKWSEGHGLVFDRKGRGTTDIDNYEDFKDATGQLLTREMTDAFPYIKGAGQAIDCSGKATATGMLIGDIKASNGSLVVDGVWNLTAAEVEDDTVVSTGLEFNESSRLAITDATMAELCDDMPAGGYLLATGVEGSVVPKLVRAAGDTHMKLVLNDDGKLYLKRSSGVVLIVK